ncbi:uncharacterized protein LOC117119170 [Anneissia japonica]|uniref:uncharacterized protein LOC117119170 n=1 Tax=Anneissia japonica TaxID=1529436 RepID=UPI00142568AE|nr:uncharacterized protein LOC117119170 [Anneissia japonica]
MSTIPGILAQSGSSVTGVDPATAKLGENAEIPYTLTPAEDVIFFEPEVTIQQSQKREHCPGSDTGLVVGMTFLGIVIGIVLSSVVFANILKTSSSKSSEEAQTGKQVETYMTYTSEQKTESQTYQDLSTNEDPVVYMNVKTKR